MTAQTGVQAGWGVGLQQVCSTLPELAAVLTLQSNQEKLSNAILNAGAQTGSFL